MMTIQSAMYNSQTLPEMRLLNVGYAANNRDWNFENINSPFSRLYYVVEGIARIHINGKLCELRPGYMYLIPAFTLHSCECESIFCHYYIHFYEDNNIRGNSIMAELDLPFELNAEESDKILFETVCSHNNSFALKHINPKEYDNEFCLIERIRLCRTLPLYLRLESVGIIYHILSKFIQAARDKYSISDIRMIRVKEYIDLNINSLNTPPL